MANVRCARSVLAGRFVLVCCDPGGDSGGGTTTAATSRGAIEDLQNQIEDLDLALARVDDGTYGIDEITGEPIEPARLEAEPTARTNI